jgi:hypothetical protein
LLVCLDGAHPRPRPRILVTGMMASEPSKGFRDPAAPAGGRRPPRVGDVDVSWLPSGESTELGAQAIQPHGRQKPG